MNIFNINLLTSQISNYSKLLSTINARTLITSTVMKNDCNLPSAPGSGKSDRRGPMKKTGKPLEKFGATSEERYFYGKQKEQLEKLKKDLKKKMPLTSRKKDK